MSYEAKQPLLQPQPPSPFKNQRIVNSALNAMDFSSCIINFSKYLMDLDVSGKYTNPIGFSVVTVAFFVGFLFFYKQHQRHKAFGSTASESRGLLFAIDQRLKNAEKGIRSLQLKSNEQDITVMAEIDKSEGVTSVVSRHRNSSSFAPQPRFSYNIFDESKICRRLIVLFINTFTFFNLLLDNAKFGINLLSIPFGILSLLFASVATASESSALSLDMIANRSAYHKIDRAYQESHQKHRQLLQQYQDCGSALTKSCTSEANGDHVSEVASGTFSKSEYLMNMILRGGPTWGAAVAPISLYLIWAGSAPALPISITLGVLGLLMAVVEARSTAKELRNYTETMSSQVATLIRSISSLDDDVEQLSSRIQSSLASANKV